MQYAQDVVDGTLPACKFIILACQRYFRMAEQAESRGWHFDKDKAQNAIDFFSYLEPSIGEFAGKPIELMPWQQFILWNLFGWYKSEDNTRLFREAYIEIPRKNGKSTFASGIGLYMLMADGEPGAQVFSAATKKEQAKVIWDEAVLMVKASRTLQEHLQCYQTAIVHEASHSKFSPLSSDDEKMSGKNIHCGLIDELHEHTNRKVYDILKTSLGTRVQPLIFSITTAGYDRESICWRQHAYGEKVLTGNLDDEGSQAFFVYMAALDAGADCFDEKEWLKCNPALGACKKLNYMRQMASQAKSEPTALNAFLRYELNQWTQQDTRFMPMDKWDLCSGDPKLDYNEVIDAAEESLAGRDGYGGLDLSSTGDVTAFVMLFPPCSELKELGPDPDNPKQKKEAVLRKADDKWRILCRFWIPEENVKKRSEYDRVPYDTWARFGIVTLTPGNVIDYDFVREEVRNLSIRHHIQECAFDRWNATQIVQQLTNDGLTMVEFGQGYRSMSAPTKELLRLVLSEQIVHYGNPCLRWMADNLVVSQDPAGNYKPDKAKSTEKIDGMVALVMALGRATASVAEEFDAETAIEAW